MPLESREKQFSLISHLTKHDVLDFTYKYDGNGRCDYCFAKSWFPGSLCISCDIQEDALLKYCFDEPIDGINICSFRKQKGSGRRHASLYMLGQIITVPHPFPYRWSFV